MFPLRPPVAIWPWLSERCLPARVRFALPQTGAPVPPPRRSGWAEDATGGPGGNTIQPEFRFMQPPVLSAGNNTQRLHKTLDTTGKNNPAVAQCMEPGHGRAPTRFATQASAPDAEASVSTSLPTRSLPKENLVLPRRPVDRCLRNSLRLTAILDIPAPGATPRRSISAYDKEDMHRALGYFLT